MSEAGWETVQLLLNEAVRVLAPVLVGLVMAAVSYGIGLLRARLGEARWDAVERAVRFAVMAAEQTGLREQAFRAGAKKKELALTLAQGWLSERGIRVDVGQLSALIEAEVMRSLNLEAVVAERKMPF